MLVSLISEPDGESWFRFIMFIWLSLSGTGFTCAHQTCTLPSPVRNSERVVLFHVFYFVFIGVKDVLFFLQHIMMFLLLIGFFQPAQKEKEVLFL